MDGAHLSSILRRRAQSQKTQKSREIQQILEDMEASTEDPGTREDEDTVMVAQPGNPPDRVGPHFTDSSLTLDNICATMRYVAGAADALALKMNGPESPAGPLAALPILTLPASGGIPTGAGNPLVIPVSMDPLLSVVPSTLGTAATVSSILARPAGDSCHR